MGSALGRLGSQESPQHGRFLSPGRQLHCGKQGPDFARTFAPDSRRERVSRGDALSTDAAEIGAANA